MVGYGMNYETATNFELNKRLAELLGMQIADVFDSPFNYATSQKDAVTRKAEYESRYPNTVWARKEGEPWEQFVFTHDWCQTMPLAVEHEISVIRLNDGYVAFTGWVWIDMSHHDCMDDIAIDGDEFIFHANTCHLRAIVICLIKVLEAKNGN